MASEQFDIGDDAVLTLQFGVATTSTDPVTTFVSNGQRYLYTDPTSPTCTVIDPTGTETVVALTKQSTGVYTGVFTPTVDGDHWYRGAGTGAAKSAGESVFHVRKRRVT